VKDIALLVMWLSIAALFVWAFFALEFHRHWLSAVYGIVGCGYSATYAIGQAAVIGFDLRDRWKQT
jgi:hypothetical protein